MIVISLSFFVARLDGVDLARPRGPQAAALRNLVPDAFPAPAPAPAPVRNEDESDDEVMPTRKKRGYVTLSDRSPVASRPSRPPDASSSDDEVMPTKRPRGPPKRRGN